MVLNRKSYGMNSNTTRITQTIPHFITKKLKHTYIYKTIYIEALNRIYGCGS
jgi:hypothetical protein